MTTTRLPRNKENPFVVLPLSAARTDNLSGTEFKLLTVLLSLPEGWQPNAKHLSAAYMAEGTYAVSRALKKLKDKGYLVCRSVRDSFGRFLRTDWDIHEAPQKPEGENLDINGNIVEFDSAAKRKNLRQTAKEKRAKAKPETIAVSAFNPRLVIPNLDNCELTNIDIPNIHPNLEREARACVENQEDGEDAGKDLELRFVKESEFCTQPEVLKLDKSSANVASGSESANSSNLREFQSQLEDLGKRLGRKSPVAWAYAIVKNLSSGNPCTYWDEFKAGIPLGTSEQREWEITPGVACSIAIQCLQQDYLSRPGTTPQEAALKAARTIARPKEMAAVWESIKSQVMFRRSEWERQSALGVETPMLDSWMVPRQPVTVEEVAIALQEIQSALPVALLPSQELLPIVEVKSAIGGENAETVLAKALPDVAVTDCGSKAALESERIATAAKAKISAILTKFARPTKRVATLAANMAEVKNAGTTPVAKLLSSGGGLADYLRQIEVAEDDIW